MISKIVYTFIIIALLMTTIISLSQNNLTAQNNLSEGEQPYTPTRLEWLALQLRAKNDSNIPEFLFSKPTKKVTLYYRVYPNRHKNTIFIDITHYDDITLKDLENIVLILGSDAETVAEKLGWSDWIIIAPRTQSLNYVFDKTLEDRGWKDWQKWKKKTSE